MVVFGAIQPKFRVGDFPIDFGIIWGKSMDGMGSGRRGGRGLFPGKTSGYHAIDLAWLRYRGCLTLGSTGELTRSRSETVTGSIRYSIEANGLRLR